MPRSNAVELAAEPPLLVRETCKLAWTAAGLAAAVDGFYEWQQLAVLVAALVRTY